MRIFITNAGEYGLMIAEFLRERVSNPKFPITNITTEGCWLETWRMGSFILREEWFPNGQVSFDLDPVEFCPDCLANIFTYIFGREGKKINLHFVFQGYICPETGEEIDIHFTIA